MLLFYKTLIMFGLHLKNYKSFEDQTFDFSKINILIGTNSSGKSALLKFFLMLGQSCKVISGNNLMINSVNTDLGAFEDIVTDNNINNDIEVEFALDIKEPQYISQTATIDLPEGKVRIKYKFDKDLLIKNVQINHPILGCVIVTASELVHDQSRFLIESQKCSIDYEYKGIKKNFSDILYNQRGLFFILDKDNIIPEGVKTLISYTMPFSIFIKYLEYYNPFLTTLKRTYPVENYSDADSIKDLANAIQVLQVDSVHRNYDLTNILKEALKDLGIADDFEIIKSDKVKVLELQVKAIGDDKFRNILDIGFGVSLQIPLLLQAISSNRLVEGATILIEQPEIHIHPKLQAKLMEVLVKYGEKNTYFIETHSIHFIEALQVMVKKGLVKKEDVTIHYFTKENSRTKVSVHKIEEDGYLDIPIPKEFMSVSFDLVSQLLD